MNQSLLHLKRVQEAKAQSSAQAAPPTQPQFTQHHSAAADAPRAENASMHRDMSGTGPAARTPSDADTAAGDAYVERARRFLEQQSEDPIAAAETELVHQRATLAASTVAPDPSDDALLRRMHVS